MHVLPFIISPLARLLARKQIMDLNKAIKVQKQILAHILKRKSSTKYGQAHGLDKISTYEQFRQKVPLQTYESLEPYIHSVRAGEKDVLWPGRPSYFAKTSGTTSGSKYIPITRVSMPNHLWGARHTLLHYIYETKDISFLHRDRKMLFLSGSPQLQEENGISIIVMK